jgi:hypothetical protein
LDEGIDQYIGIGEQGGVSTSSLRPHEPACDLRENIEATGECLALNRVGEVREEK